MVGVRRALALRGVQFTAATAVVVVVITGSLVTILERDEPGATIHGLPDGRVALLTKIHHSVVDGISGNEIMAVLLDPEPEGRVIDPAPAGNGPGAFGVQSFSEAFLTQYWLYFELISVLLVAAVVAAIAVVKIRSDRRG